MHWVPLLLFCSKSGFSTSEIEKLTSEKKFFFSEIGISLGSVGERIGLSEKSIEAENIKDIKVFRTKKV